MKRKILNPISCLLFMFFGIFVSSCKRYVVPSYDLNGSVNAVKGNFVYFNFLEKFQSSNLEYSAYDKSRSIVLDIISQSKTIHQGLNQLRIKVNSFTNGTDLFVMEIENPKGEKTRCKGNDIKYENSNSISSLVGFLESEYKTKWEKHFKGVIQLFHNKIFFLNINKSVEIICQRFKINY